MVIGGRFGKGEELPTAISKCPSWAARCKDVFPLSAKSMFCTWLGLFLMMRLRRVRSLRWMARRIRMEGSIIFNINMNDNGSKGVGGF